MPANTDGVLSDRLTQELTRSVAAERPGWTVLLFPQIPFGASGYNEVGGHYVFPGTYAVRPSTLRAVFMDLASELGEQGFRWIAVVHVHGSPLHLLDRNPLYQEWIKTSKARDDQLDAKQKAWTAK